MSSSIVPLFRQSARAQRAQNARKRGTWNGVNPVTKVIKSKKVYDRTRKKRFTHDEGNAFFLPRNAVYSA